MKATSILVASALGVLPVRGERLYEHCPPTCAPDAPYNTLCSYFAVPDEGFDEQWHIEAVRACEAWDEGFTGAGVVVGVVDYGVLPGHPDWVNQVEPAEPLGCSENPPDPLPPVAVRYAHGTMIAGVIAAEAENTTGLCSNTIGIAFDARIAEVFIWNGTGIDDVEIADSLSFRNDCIDVKANSYDISGLTAEFAYVDDQYVLPALVAGVELGRSRLGEVYVFSAGNEGEVGVLARTDYDELVSSRYTIAVGAISPDYTVWSDSEGGASLFCSGPGDKMFMPSRASQANFDPDYTCAPGTSFSTPVVAAVVALMMEANTNLSWRDVMEAIVQTAATIDPGAGWFTNQAGNNHSYEYGHGLIDAYEAVSFVTGTNGYPAWEPLPGRAADRRDALARRCADRAGADAIAGGRGGRQHAARACRTADEHLHPGGAGRVQWNGGRGSASAEAPKRGLSLELPDTLGSRGNSAWDCRTSGYDMDGRDELGEVTRC